LEQACALLNYGYSTKTCSFRPAANFWGLGNGKAHCSTVSGKLANKQFLVNLEKAAQRYETWIESRSPGHIAAMRQFMKQMRAQAASAAKA